MTNITTRPAPTSLLRRASPGKACGPGEGCAGRLSSGGLANAVGRPIATTAEAAALSFGKAAPDPELLAVFEGVLQAVFPDDATAADLLCFAVDPPLSGKKRSGSTPKQLAERCHVGGCTSKRSPVASAGRRKNRTISVTGGSPRSWSRRSRSGREEVLPAAPAFRIRHLGSTYVTTNPVTTLVLSSLIAANCARGDFNFRARGRSADGQGPPTCTPSYPVYEVHRHQVRPHGLPLSARLRRGG